MNISPMSNVRFSGQVKIVSSPEDLKALTARLDADPDLAGKTIQLLDSEKPMVTLISGKDIDYLDRWEEQYKKLVEVYDSSMQEGSGFGFLGMRLMGALSSMQAVLSQRPSVYVNLLRHKKTVDDVYEAVKTELLKG